MRRVSDKNGLLIITAEYTNTEAAELSSECRNTIMKPDVSQFLSLDHNIRLFPNTKQKQIDDGFSLIMELLMGSGGGLAKRY